MRATSAPKPASRSTGLGDLRISKLLVLIAAVAAAGCGGGAAPAKGNAAGAAGETFTVTIQNGQGQPGDALKIRGGRVFTSDLSINCGVGENGEALTACSGVFPANTTVVLEASPSGSDPRFTPPKPYMFVGWAGDCWGEGDCTLTGNADKYVVASFSGVRTSHPNFTSPIVHAPLWRAYESGTGSLDCTSCHGSNLQGQGLAVSCSGCHASPLSPVQSFYATPSSIVAGQSATLAWTLSGTTSATIDNGVGVVTGSQVTVSPSTTTTYTLTATNATGTATRSATVTVQPPLGDSGLSADPDLVVSVQQGAQVTASVSLFNAGTFTRYVDVAVVNPHDDLYMTVLPGPVPLAPGQATSILVHVDAAVAAAGVRDDIMLSFGLDDGSTLYSNVRVTVDPAGASPLPDLVVRSMDIRLAGSSPGVSFTVAADVRNVGSVTASDVRVSFLRFGAPIGSEVVRSLPGGSSATVTVTAPLTTTNGDQLITIVVDPLGSIEETTEENNEASRAIRIGASQTLDEGILVMGSLPTEVCTGRSISVSGRATYDLVVNGVRTNEYVVKGAPVEVKMQSATSTATFAPVHTNIYGDFSRSLVPTTPGVYRVYMTVTDKTFTGTRELVFTALDPADARCVTAEIKPELLPYPVGIGGGGGGGDGGGGGVWECLAPDRCVYICDPDRCPVPPNLPALPSTDVFVWSEDIYFSNDRPAVDEEVTVFARIRYWSNDTSVRARDVPVSIYATAPGSPPVLVGHAVIPSISVASPDYGGRYFFGTWRVPAEGVYIIEFAVDPTYVEPNVLNNAATRAIVVGQYTGTLGAIAGHASSRWGGVADVIVRVYDSVGATIGSTMTDATGFYLVENVPPGELRVVVEPPAPWIPVEASRNVSVATHALGTADFRLSNLSLSPTSATVAPFGSSTFTGVGGVGTYTWSIAPNRSGGSITQSGVYTAGATGDVTDTIVLTDADGASVRASVAVGPGGPPPVWAQVVAAGGRTFGILSDGTLWGWGDNTKGLIGDGTFTSPPRPVLIGSGFASIAASSSHAMAIKRDGTLWAWGLNTWGQLGDGTIVTKARPQPVWLGWGVHAGKVAVGPGHSLVVTTDGQLYAWGDARQGRISGAPLIWQTSPLLQGTGFAWAAAGGGFSAAVAQDGTLYTWGSNSMGQLADVSVPLTSYRSTLVPVGTDYARVSASGGGHVLAIKSDGTLLGWGNNAVGQVGDGTTTNRPLPVPIGSDYATVETGNGTSIGVRSNGDLMCWGNNGQGQVGIGGTANQLVPARIGTDFASASISGRHGAAVTADGRLFAWGDNSGGSFGNGTTISASTPIEIPLPSIAVPGDARCGTVQPGNTCCLDGTQARSCCGVTALAAGFQCCAGAAMPLDQACCTDETGGWACADVITATSPETTQVGTLSYDSSGNLISLCDFNLQLPNSSTHWVEWRGDEWTTSGPTGSYTSTCRPPGCPYYPRRQGAWTDGGPGWLSWWGVPTDSGGAYLTPVAFTTQIVRYYVLVGDPSSTERAVRGPTLTCSAPQCAYGFHLYDGVCVSNATSCGDLTENEILQNWSYYAEGGFATSLQVLQQIDAFRGLRALRAQTSAGFDFALVYTAPAGTVIDASTAEALRFSVRGTNTTPNGWQGRFPVVVFEDAAGNRRQYAPVVNRLNTDGAAWIGVTMPLGGGTDWIVTGQTVDFASLRKLEIHADTWDYGFTLDIDSVSFDRAGAACPINW